MLRQIIKSVLPLEVMENLRLLRFWLVRQTRGFAIPDAPHFDPESTVLFRELITSCTGYLEYGTGGSTVLAHALKKPFVAIDSDRHFLADVGRKLGPLSPQQHLLHADVGVTGPWGVPVCSRPTAPRLARWRSYAELPWQRALPGTDLVLVDGRFRVACALASLRHLTKSSDVLLVDDYAERPEYWVVEKFARLERMVGRMAVFRPMPHDVGQRERAFEHFAQDYD
jgi:hypothetical protein